MTGVAEETRVDLLAERQAAHNDALAEWRRLDRAVKVLERDGILVDLNEPAPERTMRSGRKPRGRELADVVERETTLAELTRQRQDAARKVVEARTPLEAAKIAVTNEKLAGLAPAHTVAAERVERARAAAEQAFVELVARGIVLREALVDELRVARGMRKAALDGAPQAARERLASLIGIEGRLPLALDDTGTATATVDRPEGNLFLLGAAAWDVAHADCGQEVVDLVRGGRGRVGSTSERVAHRVARRLEQIDAAEEA